MGQEINLIQLQKDDVPLIIEMEKKAWVPGARATRDSLLKRFDLGHTMFGSINPTGELSGLAAFGYSQVDIEDQESFPKTFDEFSTTRTPQNFNSSFAYNLSVIPEEKGKPHATNLIKAVLLESKNRGCEYTFGDGRCSSYNGSLDTDHEKIEQQPSFKASLDKYIATGEFPSIDELTQDPTLRFYRRHLKCDFPWIIPDFLPTDKPTGGFRVILRVDLSRVTNGGYVK